MKKELKIVYYHLDKINAAKYNPRSITDNSKKGLSKSLSEFDLLAPLILNVENNKNILVSGHRRLEDLVTKGFNEFPIVEVRLNEAKEKALNLTMNNLKIQGFFNDDLDALLGDLQNTLDAELFDDLNLQVLEEIAKGEDAYYAFLNVNRPDLDFNSVSDEWKADLDKLDKVDENAGDYTTKILITCKPLDKDAVLIYLKEKLMETSFEGIHVK